MNLRMCFFDAQTERNIMYNLYLTRFLINYNDIIVKSTSTHFQLFN